MTQKHKQDPETGLVRQPFSKVVIGGILFFAILIIGSTILPYHSIYYLYLSVPFGIFGFINLLWINIRPNLYARFFLNICITALCVIISCRAFDNLLPRFSFLGAAFIMTTVVVAHALPILNSHLANVIRDELSEPKTKIGKFLFRVSLVLIPFIGILFAMLETVLHRENKSNALSVILVAIFWLFPIILPFAYRFPSSPWESKRR